MSRFAVPAIIACLVTLLEAQGPADRPPDITFEAASVKPNRSGEGAFGPPRFQGTSLLARNVPVDILIRMAYGGVVFGAAATPLVGGPDWISESSRERFDVTARMAEGTSSRDRLIMLQRLLEDRFALRIRWDTQELPVYVLSTLETGGTLGPNLRRAARDCSPSVCGGYTTMGDTAYQGADWSAVIQSIAPALDRQIVDRSGLSGKFDFELKYSQSLSPNLNDATVDIFSAVRQQLGLKLESGRAPVRVLAIESISRPTPD
jgi:uncharacterized protein (TIGR03435 family)